MRRVIPSLLAVCALLATCQPARAEQPRVAPQRFLLLYSLTGDKRFLAALGELNGAEVTEPPAQGTQRQPRQAKSPRCVTRQGRHACEGLAEPRDPLLDERRPQQRPANAWPRPKGLARPLGDERAALADPRLG
ncbi:hypothetical protein [Pseudomonas panipatensis]|uniref:hypothetical protein n=1 Tax=Pseudomonas panipatensis TaxID=428992 RepID=UPI0035AFF9A4